MWHCFFQLIKQWKLSPWKPSLDSLWDLRTRWTGKRTGTEDVVGALFRGFKINKPVKQIFWSTSQDLDLANVCSLKDQPDDRIDFCIDYCRQLRGNGRDQTVLMNSLTTFTSSLTSLLLCQQPNLQLHCLQPQKTFPSSLFCPPPPLPSSVKADDFVTVFTQKVKDISCSFIPLSSGDVNRVVMSNHNTMCPLTRSPAHSSRSSRVTFCQSSPPSSTPPSLQALFQSP